MRSNHPGETLIRVDSTLRSPAVASLSPPVPWSNTRSPVKAKSNECLPRTHDRVTVAGMPKTGDSRPLTDRQRQVLDFIDAEVRERGYPPSVREIGEAVGLSSPSTVH